MALFQPPPSPFAGQTTQPVLPRVPWGSNPMVTTAALGLLGGRNLNEGLANVAQSAPAGMVAKSGLQTNMYKIQEDQAERARQRAAMNAGLKLMSGHPLTPEEQAAYADSPDVALKFETLKASQEPKGVFRQATQEEAAGYNASAGQFGPDGRFYPQDPPSGMAIEADGQGGFRMVQGPGAGKNLTEGQSKDTVFATRAEGALQILDTVDTELTSFPQRMAEGDPTGLLRGLQSDKFQSAYQSGTEFLQAVLRKDTGAAITPSEQNEYGRVYLPRPGDGPVQIEQKRASRHRALEAIKAGMPPQAILAQELALQRGETQPAAPATGGDGWTEVEPGVRIREVP